LEATDVPEKSGDDVPGAAEGRTKVSEPPEFTFELSVKPCENLIIAIPVASMCLVAL